MKPERIGREVERELSRFGPSAAGMTDIVRAWPECVGEQIAQNAWPARLARDGTLHVATSSSAWAFELAQLAPTLLDRLREQLGDLTPERARFAPGKLPEPFAAPAERLRNVKQPTEADRELAAAMAAEIENESLRRIVAKAAAASLARPS